MGEAIPCCQNTWWKRHWLKHAETLYGLDNIISRVAVREAKLPNSSFEAYFLGALYMSTVKVCCQSRTFKVSLCLTEQMEKSLDGTLPRRNGWISHKMEENG